MKVTFSGEIFEWRGPAPHHFVATPDEASEDIAEIAAAVTYGWGVLPVLAQIGDTEWKTSLFPKDGRFLVPLKLAVRRAEGLELGQVVEVELSFDV